MTQLAKVEGWIEKAWDQLAELVPRHVNQQRFRRIVIDQIRNNRELQQCDPKSVFRACVQAANLGLEVGVLNSAYLVRYGKQCVLVPGYAGLIQLARNSGAVTAVNVYTVRYNDEVQQNGDGEIVVRFNPFDKNRGHVVGAVCVVTMHDGSKQYTTMTQEEYESVRPGHWERTPHATHREEMWKKSCVRRAMKTIPLAPEVSDVLSNADSAEFQDAEVVVRGPKRGGNDAVSGLLDELGQDPEPEVVELDLESDPVPGPGRDLKAELGYANNIIDLMGVEDMPKWAKITPDREKMLAVRMEEEGIEDPQEFWHRALEVLTPFDPRKVEGWPACTLEIFLRVPAKHGTANHWQRAVEGAYRPNGNDVPDPIPYDPLSDE